MHIAEKRWEAHPAPHEAPAAPGSSWTLSETTKNKKPAASGFSGHYWTTLDANENPTGGPGVYRITAVKALSTLEHLKPV